MLDILLLQEMHLVTDKYPIFNRKRFPQQYQALGNSKSWGVAILICNNIRFTETSSLKDPEGRYLFINGFLETNPITLTGLYVPNSNQVQYLQSYCLSWTISKQTMLLLVETSKV